jgi:hypothetical protein
MRLLLLLIIFSIEEAWKPIGGHNVICTGLTEGPKDRIKQVFNR